MFCAKCGNKLSDGARFCVNCGAPVAARDGADVPVSAQGDAQGGDAPDATVAAPVLVPADATSDAAPGPDTVSAEPEAASAADAPAAPTDTAAKKKKTPFIIAAGFSLSSSSALPPFSCWATKVQAISILARTPRLSLR